jgi:hypothetical protein
MNTITITRAHAEALASDVPHPGLDAALAAIRSALDAPAPEAQPVAWRYWKDKFACGEYSDVPLEFPAVPAGTKMHPLGLKACLNDWDWQTFARAVKAEVLRRVSGGK